VRAVLDLYRHAIVARDPCIFESFWVSFCFTPVSLKAAFQLVLCNAFTSL